MGAASARVTVIETFTTFPNVSAIGISAGEQSMKRPSVSPARIGGKGVGGG
jgi:hypothetical protein